MTGPKGNSEFVSLRHAVFPLALPRETLRSQGNSLFPAGPVIKCFVILPNSKLEKPAKKLFAFCRLAHKICRGFKEHDLIMCKLKVHVVVYLGS